MAWNEPPEGRGKDPWGGRGGDNKGPPDLDQALRNLQAQLAGIFGGKSGRDRGGPGGGGSGNNVKPGVIVGGVAGALFVLWGLAGIYQVDQQERGVVFRFGALLDDIVLPGLQWNPPLIDQVQFVNVTQIRSIKHQAPMLTEDENIVDVSLTVQYAVKEARDFVVNVKDPEESLKQATESALRHVAGSSSMDEMITEGRAAVAIEVQERLQSYLDAYGTGIAVNQVNIDQTGPPKQVKEAFDDVQKAREDEQRSVNEANAHAEAVIPVARGEAQRQIEEANAYREQVVARAEGEAQRFVKLFEAYSRAKEVTRDRMYIDAMESMLSQSTKVLIDVKGGNNMLYLPLDKIIERSTGAPGTPQLTPAMIENITESVITNIRARSEATPRREGRS